MLLAPLLLTLCSTVLFPVHLLVPGLPCACMPAFLHPLHLTNLRSSRVCPPVHICLSPQRPSVAAQSVGLLKLMPKNTPSQHPPQKERVRYNFNNSNSLRRLVQHHLASIEFSLYFWLLWEKLLQVYLQIELNNSHKYNKNLWKCFYNSHGLLNVGAKHDICKSWLVFTPLKKSFTERWVVLQPPTAAATPAHRPVNSDPTGHGFHWYKTRFMF